MHRKGQWLPQDNRVQQAWLSSVIADIDLHPKQLHPILEEFQELIEGDTKIYMLMQSMFEEVPHKPPYHMDPTRDFTRIKDYKVSGYKNFLVMFSLGAPFVAGPQMDVSITINQTFVSSSTGV
jgi:hypothetical protein